MNSAEKFLHNVREYIERMEVDAEGEWGLGRTLKELIEQKCMPEIYNEVLIRIEDLKCPIWYGYMKSYDE